MDDLILTGASRGIGHALALELARTRKYRLILVARDAARLESMAGEVRALGSEAVTIAADLGSVSGARRLGQQLVAKVNAGATLVHNAGLWPSRRNFSPEGLESAFVVNHLAPLALQEPLLERGLLARIFVVGAGLMVKGRFDPGRTPKGADFSGFRTYCTTKLCFAVAMRDVAARHPDIDVAVVHPGVVRTDLGARSGLLGWVLARAKRRFEPPERCAARLAKLVLAERWSPPGEARWWMESTQQPWPAAASDPATRASIRDVTTRLLAAQGV